MKSGGDSHRFSLNKQLKLPYELCFFTKNQSTQISPKNKNNLQSQVNLR